MIRVTLKLEDKNCKFRDCMTSIKQILRSILRSQKDRSNISSWTEVSRPYGEDSIWSQGGYTPSQTPEIR